MKAASEQEALVSSSQIEDRRLAASKMQGMGML